MPRVASRPRVSRINLEVVRRAFRDRPGPGESDFYILEKTDGPCTRNPASRHVLPRFEESRAEEFLDDKGYAAVGEVLRDLETRLALSPLCPYAPSMRSGWRSTPVPATALSCFGRVLTGVISTARSPVLESRGPKETAPREGDDGSFWDPKPCGLSRPYRGPKAPNT